MADRWNRLLGRQLFPFGWSRAARRDAAARPTLADVDKVQASRVIRVIVGGEWVGVQKGTFRVVDYVFYDDDGNPINESTGPAYYFISTNGDPYFGPLEQLQLIKLLPESQVVRAGEPAAERSATMELPEAPMSFDAAPSHVGEQKPASYADLLFAEDAGDGTKAS
ncbi:MAG: hypothetical protein KatS3mg008_1932 [Acidimicrobiales bacterium]|nr:MAG: hypothetical protein KatS3mg008_1932 [Acidimicrobiales bacterium]